MRTPRVQVCHPAGGKMLTKQSEKDSTDVNLIMDSWIHAGAAVAGHLNPAKGSYGDFSSGVGYHEALDAVMDAQKCFSALPAKIRSHVENDPGQFLDLVFDPERRDELERLGIVDDQRPKGAGDDVGGDLDGVKKSGPTSPPKSTGADDPGDAPREDVKGVDPAGSLFD